MLNTLGITKPDDTSATETGISLNADVVVIGAGLAGLVMANALAESGLQVVVLESGAEQQIEDVHPLNEVELTGHVYRGATEGRFRGLGGTSTRWGAAFLPYLSEEMAPHPCGWHQGWGIDPGKLEAHLASLEKTFGVAAGSYEGTPEQRGLLKSFLPRLPKWPAFGRRATSNIYRDKILNDPRLSVWTEATVTEIILDGARVTGVVGRNRSGDRLTVTAPRVAITAGAIETTRLLLLLDRARKAREGASLFPSTNPLGMGFHDHLSAVIAVLDPVDRKALARLFSFQFVSGGMRNLRFELSPDARAEPAEGLPAAFLHIGFTREGANGFEGLRRLYQSVQRRTRPAAGDIAMILADLPWFVRAGWWRFVEGRVLPPNGSKFEIHLVTEQKPDAASRIDLSTDKLDAFGQPCARIHWNVSDEDLMHFDRISERALGEWTGGPLVALAQPHARPSADVARDLVEGGGIYHPAGTTRMGASASDSVVDARLRVHNLTGLWAVATSAFPAVGGTSPSLGLMQCALHAADDITSTPPVL